MYKLFLVLTLIFMTGCTTSPRNYFNFTLSASEEVLVASDLAWLIKEKHGAAATFEFDYPMWSRSTSFSQALEIALRKQGLAVYVKNINEEKQITLGTPHADEAEKSNIVREERKHHSK